MGLFGGIEGKIIKLRKKWNKLRLLVLQSKQLKTDRTLKIELLRNLDIVEDSLKIIEEGTDEGTSKRLIPQLERDLTRIETKINEIKKMKPTKIVEEKRYPEISKHPFGLLKK